MNERPRIALIHATRIAIAPIEQAANDLWPEAETITILEEGLSVDRAKSEDLTGELADRIVSLAHYAQGAGADGILFTCSAFGSAIEAAADAMSVPVMKPNEAMFEAAFAYGGRATLIYTFPPSAAGMEEEFRAAAAQRGRPAKIAPVFCDGALDAKQAGDEETHDRLIAETAAGISDADVILLAQFSMAGAALQARARTHIPILTSPEAAIEAIRARVLAATKESGAC